MNTVRERIDHASGWLDDKMLAVFGPPPLGPYGPDADHDPHPGPADALCPVCHRALAHHDRELSNGHVFLMCPTGEVLETAPPR